MTSTLQTALRPAETRLAGLTLRPCVLPPGGPRHAFTMDVEDWQQSVFDPSLPVSHRFADGVRRAIGLLDRHGAKGTFFVLGNAAEAAPELVRELSSAGHEVQTHGYGHRPLHRMSRAAFREDLLRARGIIEGLTGRAVTGYRAPRFSIDLETLWALDVLAECGFAYDSSIFPMRIRGYGISGFPPGPQVVRTSGGAELIEAPVAVVRWLGRSLPVGGGGYFRLLPRGMIVRRLRSLDSAGRPIVLYCHPYEFDPAAFREMPLSVPLATRLHQGLGRRGFSGKVEAVLAALDFGTLGAALGLEEIRGGGSPPSPMPL